MVGFHLYVASYFLYSSTYYSSHWDWAMLVSYWEQVGYTCSIKNKLSHEEKGRHIFGRSTTTHSITPQGTMNMGVVGGDK